MTNNQYIFSLAEKYGFDECGIISAEPFYEFNEHLDYEVYGDDFEIQYDPKKYWENAKYIITLIKAYKPYKKESFSNDHIYVDAYYVTGNDSYFKAKKMAGEIAETGHSVKFSPRIPYRHCAFRAGFGIRGMNGLLVNEKYGSYMHIQCIFTDMPLEITSDIKKVETCNKCEICLLSCKANALEGNGKVDVNKCIRHFMPAKIYVPENIREITGSSFIGCTDCREECPYNKKVEHIEPPKDLLAACYMPVLLDTNNAEYKKQYMMLRDYLGKNEVRPLKLMKAVAIVAGNTNNTDYIPILQKLKDESEDKELIEYIDWAIKNNKLTKL